MKKGTKLVWNVYAFGISNRELRVFKNWQSFVESGGKWETADE